MAEHSTGQASVTLKGTAGKEFHDFHFDGKPIDLVGGIGSQHSSFLAKENH